MPTVVAAKAAPHRLQSPPRAPWVWWHLLSLDAPTVAALWCWFFAYAARVHLRGVALPTLALGTWCVYVADRLLDGWRARETARLRDRHWFYLRHRRLFTVAWMAAAVPLGYLILARVQRGVRADDLALGLIGAVYFLLIHAGQGSRGTEPWMQPSKLPRATEEDLARWFPKEMAVGFLFAIATAVPTWARISADRGALLAAVFAFGCLCWLNCVAIQVWEDAHAASARSRPPRLTAFLGRHLRRFSMAVGALGLTLAGVTAHTPWWPVFAAVLLSAALFLGLARASERWSALSLRIAADAALLTPLLFLLRFR